MRTSRILLLSATGGLLFAVVGLVWGVISSSQMILFDGAYSTIGLGLSVMALLTFRYIEKEDHDLFPFGKGTLEPMVVIIKAVVLGLLCLVAIYSSVMELATGGREVLLGHALAYASLCSLACLIVYLVMRKNDNSELVKAEVAQWLMDTIISLAVLFGFIVARILDSTNLAFLVPYIDPFMVLIASIYFLTVPYSLIKSNGRELLGMAARKEVQEQIITMFEPLVLEYQLTDIDVKTSKIGSILFVEATMLVNKTSFTQTIKEMDHVREHVQRKLEVLPYEKRITITFTQA